MPDLDRLGGLEWVRRTKGKLNGREYARLLLAMGGSTIPDIAGYIRLLVGWVPERARKVDVRSFQPPASTLAGLAEKASNSQPPQVLMHSYRTWMLGLALAQADRCALDPELFYCAALLHDLGLGHATNGVDFTLAGANRAIECAANAGLSQAEGELIADGICAHATAGISNACHGEIGYYVQWGSMADIAGLRMWDITRANADAIYRRYPRGATYGRDCAEMIRSEARAVPSGRFALYKNLGMAALCQWMVKARP